MQIVVENQFIPWTLNHLINFNNNDIYILKMTNILLQNSNSDEEKKN